MRKVPNLTLRREDGRVVAESVVVADSTGRRLRGLLGKKELPSGHGVLLRPAWSIHTAFMRFPIDVVFLDADQIVIKIVPNLPSFKTASCRGAREVVELRAGECERYAYRLGRLVADVRDDGEGIDQLTNARVPDDHSDDAGLGLCRYLRRFDPHAVEAGEDTCDEERAARCGQ